MDGGEPGGRRVVTGRTKFVAALIVLAVAVGVYFGLSEPPTSDRPRSVATTSAAAPDARAVRPTRAARAASTQDESPPANAVAPSTDDPSKWPIRVTTNVPGATVTMQVRLFGGDPDPPPETKTTDAHGFVGFATPAKEVAVHEFKFVAHAEGRRTTREELTQPGDVRIELKDGVVVRGRVTDDAGRPIKGATFVLSSDWPAAGTTEEVLAELLAESDSDGSFEAFLEKPGAVSFRVQHSAFLERDVSAAAPATGLVVVLERGLEVSGRVAFPDGRPVPGVAMTEDSGRWRATTDADGRYVASGLARGPVTLVCAFAPEKRTVDAGATNVDFIVGLSVARVRFVDADARPFRYAATTIRVTKGGVDLHMSASSGAGESDDQMISGDRGSTVLVTASSTDGRTGSASATFDETPRLHDVDVVLGAKRPTGTIRLVVRWESPETPKSVYVTVDDEMGSTVAGDGRKRFDLDAAGAGEIPNVPAGHVKVTVAAAAHWSSEALDTLLVTSVSDADVQVGRTTEVVATLVGGGRVRATVRDEAGTAVAPDIVRVLTASDRRALDMFVHRGADGGWTSELDASPCVMIDAVPAGRYVVRASMSDGRDGEKEIDVVKGRTVDVEVTVKPTR